MLRLDEAKPGMNVRYVPYHADGEIGHSDCETGVVSSVSESYIFVRFGLAGTGTAQACNPDQLVRIGA